MQNNDLPKKRIAILGSTGSIGCQALEVIEQNADAFEVEVLSANDNATLLIEQALRFNPNAVCIANESRYEEVKSALSGTFVKVYAGQHALVSLMEMETIDLVLTALVGYAGLLPTLKAIEYGKPIALANKETLVVAGDLVTQLASEKGVNIYPVDSEHSAIFQCLAGEFHNPIEKIILTASGGPFRGKDRKFLETVAKEQALKHPNWTMGAKITIDSATLMNKGLEVIEAKWLFGLKPDQIEVVVHPQSIVHSLVQFQDGSIKAQLGLPDMKLPIQYALGYPNRISSTFPRFSFTDYPNLTFGKPDSDTFQCLNLAFKALEKGGNVPCMLNAANEVAVDAFLHDKISFLQITDIIEACMELGQYIAAPTLADYMDTDQIIRQKATDLVTEVTPA